MTNIVFQIEAYNETNAKLAKLRDMANFIPDVSTKEGYEKSKRLALDVGKVKTNLEKIRKQEKQYYLEGGRQVDSQAKEIEAELLDIQRPHLEAYKEIDNAEKIAKEKRMAKAQEKIDSITSLVDKAEFATSATIADYLEMAEGFDIDDGLYELTPDGLMAKKRVTDTLFALYERTKQAEKDAAELAVLREKQAEQEQKERDERIAREANERAEQAKRDQLLAEQAKLEAEKRAIEQEKQAKIDAENARIAAEEREKIAVENARLAEIARREAEEKIKADELAKLEADKKHVGKIRGEIKDDLIALGASEDLAKEITLALGKEIRNTKVIY